MTTPSFPTEAFENFEYYRRHFADADLWAPSVRRVLAQALGYSAGEVRSSTPGSYPVFIVDDLYVVKFFGHHLDGQHSFQVENAFGRHLVGKDFPAPALVAAGRLDPAESGCDWPYLIYAFVPGLSFCKVYRQIPAEQAQAAVNWVGRQMAHLYALSPRDEAVFPLSWQAYFAFMDEQKQSCAQRLADWASLPEPLLSQVPAYLLPVEALVFTGERPHWVHADLTCDHLYGRQAGEIWTPQALIDFGDGMTASLYYELAAACLGLCACRPDWVGAFLDGLGVDWRAEADFARKATCAALLHRFDVFGSLAHHRPELLACASLEELSARLWPAE